MKPRILWVSHTGTWVGPTNSLSLLLEHLAPRFDSTVLLTEDGAFNSLLRERGVPFISLPSLGKRAIPRMAWLMRQGGFDLVYTNNTSVAAANALVAAKLVGKPVICHIRSKWLAPLRWRDIAFRRSDAQVAVSHAVAEAFRTFLPGTHPRVVYNGVPAPTATLDRETERAQLLRELGLASDTVLALSVAHVMSRKGQAHAVDAMVEAVRHVPELVLLLVGRLDRELSYVESVRRAIGAAGLDGHVRLLGFRRDVEQLNVAADLFLHTAIVDPHPRAVIEGMRAGLPTVAFGVDGVAETVVNGQTGLLYEPGDAAGMASGMVRLALDEALRTDMGAAARQRALSVFTAEETARKVGDLIDATVRGRSVDRPDPQPRASVGL